MTKRLKRPLRLKDVLIDTLKQHELEKGIYQKQVVLFWDRLVGRNIAEVAKAERIDRDTLFVRVKSPAWRNELIFQKQGILEKINRYFNEEILKDIMFF